mgnify:CR=1 FL=1
MDENVPKGNIDDKVRVPWIDKRIKKLIRKRNILFKRTKKLKSKGLWKKYKLLRRKVKKIIKISNIEYLNNVVCKDVQKNSKAFWAYVKLKKKEPKHISCLRVNDNVITDDKLKATILNKQFESAFRIDNEQTSDETVDNDDTQCDIPPMSDIQCTVAEVYKLLKEIDSSKAQGPDEIAPRILKEAAEQLAPSVFSKN